MRNLRMVRAWAAKDSDCSITNSALESCRFDWFIPLKDLSNENYHLPFVYHETYCWVESIIALIEWSTE